MGEEKVGSISRRPGRNSRNCASSAGTRLRHASSYSRGIGSVHKVIGGLVERNEISVTKVNVLFCISAFAFSLGCMQPCKPKSPAVSPPDFAQFRFCRALFCDDEILTAQEYISMMSRLDRYKDFRIFSIADSYRH